MNERAGHLHAARPDPRREDLRSRATDPRRAVDALIETHCQSIATDEWDIDGSPRSCPVLADQSPPTSLPPAATRCPLRPVMAEACAHYAQREGELGRGDARGRASGVLRIIDRAGANTSRRWTNSRMHQLAGDGSEGPLTEWQREGFEMFGAMMKGIAQTSCAT